MDQMQGKFPGWTVTELEQGYWKAVSYNQVIVEQSMDALIQSIENSDPLNPRVDAVAFADVTPSLGLQINISI